MSLLRIVNLVRYSSGMKRFLKKLHKSYPDDLLLISVEKGIGDLCLLFAYLPEYLKSQGEKSVKIILPESPHAALLAEQFGFGPNATVVIDAKKRNMFFGSIHSTHFTVVTKDYQTNGILKMGSFEFYMSDPLRKMPSFTFLDLYKYAIFELDEDTPIHYPAVEKPKSLQELQKPYIILNPYSYSCQIPKSLFYELGVRLKNMGYNVYCNCAPGQEVIEGTTALNVLIGELYHLAKDAECIISARSGILDYVIANTKRIIALHETKRDIYMFKLDAWKTHCETHEHIYSDDLDIDMIIKEATGHGN